MQERLLPALLCLLAACGGQSAGAPAPQDTAITPESAVQNFMRAVADSNISRMGRYWGSRDGPAAITKSPADYEQRMAVTQVFLRASPFKILRTETVAEDEGRRVVVLELERADTGGNRCTRTLPVTVVKTKEHGWVVTAMDISLVGTPGRPCAAAKS